jgi:hypothetical protein
MAKCAAKRNQNFIQHVISMLQAEISPSPQRIGIVEYEHGRRIRD